MARLGVIVITAPIEKIFGFGVPKGETKGILIAQAQCPCCHQNTAAWWDRFIRGIGYVRILICDYCEYWERPAGIS